MVQREFVDGDGRLWFFDKRRPKQGLQRTTPGNLFVEGHLYSTIQEDGSRDARVEMFLSQWETRAAPIVRKIISTARLGRKPELTAVERRTIQIFIMYQLKRTPDFFKGLRFDASKQVEEIIQNYEHRFGAVSCEDKAVLTGDVFLKRAEQNARVHAVAWVSDRVLEALDGKGLQIIRIERARKSFVLGSLPLARFSAEGTTHLAHPAVELCGLM